MSHADTSMSRRNALLLAPALVLVLAACGAAVTGPSGSPTTAATDTVPPSTPAGLAAAAAGSSAINLSWTASTDNVGVTGYAVSRDGNAVATSSTTSYSDTGLFPGTTYAYTVVALDAAGNRSGPSASASAKTTGTADTLPPSTPTGLTATPSGSSVVNLSWNASTDNVGVTGYVVRRDGAPVATPTATGYTDTGLAAATTYSYTVAARDAVGNFSPFSTGASATTLPATGGTLPVGPLVHDGPATPEQISLLLPVTGALPQTATATVRYKQTGASTWTIGHPLYRIRPDLTETPDPSVGPVADAFAWPIIDVSPGTSYDIEVTVTSGAVTNVFTLTHMTRALPPAAGAANKTANSVATIKSQAASLNPGDVLEIANGTYALSIQVSRSGTAAQPIYIRAQSRSGVVISDPGVPVQVLAASHVVIENMTLQGSGTNSGTAAGSHGIEFYNGVNPRDQTRITIRNITMTGVDTGVTADVELAELLVYDNTMTGNNTWTTQTTPGTLDIDTNLTWNDDAMRIPGFGNCVFNNTIKGFGDSSSFAQHFTQVIGVHFYRNDILMGGDDGVEVDEGIRNLTYYDNRLRNTMTFVSLDPLFGGPLLVARNIMINTGRQPFKWNSPNSGQFVYNNTIVRTTGQPGTTGVPSAEAGWYQPNNGDQRSYGYRNNLLVYRGSGTQTIRLDNSGHDPVDFTHNSWFPNLVFQWPQGTFSNLLNAFNGLAATSPVFSGSTKRHEFDNISDSDPWVTPITLGPNYRTEVTVGYTPVLRAGTAPKNSGVVIPNITDGFSGNAPDRGAIIEGRAIPLYGDRSPP